MIQLAPFWYSHSPTICKDASSKVFKWKGPSNTHRVVFILETPGRGPKAGRRKQKVVGESEVGEEKYEFGITGKHEKWICTFKNIILYTYIYMYIYIIYVCMIV